ncbi:pancreatic triacylglycerol lipase-like [Pocillopora verrucosa]|uniref:pancreatic triacylglycerol lipase-like n=1 Tax=Pocillopora verrucosa TaxID=203993 RepID=UPI003341BF91
MMTKEVIFLLVILTAAAVGFLWPSKVCYEKYGCFYKHPGVHWGLITLRQKLPQSPYDVGTKFTMFTRSGSGEVNDFDRDLLRAAKFNISRRTIILIHGWQGNPKKWPLEMKDALLQREDCNVVVVDWFKGAKKGYFQSAGNTRLVGAMVGELIKFLISSVDGSPELAERFYVVGVSLGAQTAGYAGNYLKEKGIKLGRITGLDPAGPLFTKVDDIRFRLDPGDAGYVDVIHTDMPLRGSIFGLGMRRDAGHTDFFLNGGVRQPGCKKHEIDFDIFKTTLCDHARSVKYYYASVQNLCSWKAYPCQSLNDCENGKTTACIGECPSVGYGADQTKKVGRFYLRTNSKAPFCGLPRSSRVEIHHVKFKD